MHFWPKNTFRHCRLIWCPVGGLVGGCGVRAVSRKTPIYFFSIFSVYCTFCILLVFIGFHRPGLKVPYAERDHPDFGLRIGNLDSLQTRERYALIQLLMEFRISWYISLFIRYGWGSRGRSKHNWTLFMFLLCVLQISFWRKDMFAYKGMFRGFFLKSVFSNLLLLFYYFLLVN